MGGKEVKTRLAITYSCIKYIHIVICKEQQGFFLFYSSIHLFIYSTFNYSAIRLFSYSTDSLYLKLCSQYYTEQLHRMTSIFHKFIEVSASKPPEAQKFVEFAYMEQEIKKNYKQLKSTKGVDKPSEDFVDYWKEIGNIGREEQVGIYFRWIQLLDKSLTTFSHRELAQKQADLYIKTSMISKWEQRKVKLNGLVLQIFSKKLKEFPLKCFCIRKSKNKDHFSWVMEIVLQLDDSKFKSFHIGTNNVNQYQDWYREIESRIDLARIQFFKETIESQNKFELIASNGKKETLRKGSLSKKQKDNKKMEVRTPRVKTLTELVIDKQLKLIEEYEGPIITEDNQYQQVQEVQIHPNIFWRLFPNKELHDFCETPTGGTLLECEQQYRLYEVNGLIKIFITINRRLDVVFKAISESHKQWNMEIDTFNVKNKISSENSIFVYQKDKSKGFLYRQRDYFFLRHCFNLESEDKQEKLFMIEKSIDSVHHPPFMTVARGEKELTWCIMGNRQQKQSLLIVEGLIKGGGYMNSSEYKQNTIKELKKLLQMDNYLKQIELSKTSKDSCLFQQNWSVSFKEQGREEYQENQELQEHQVNQSQEQQGQDEFYSPREIESGEFQSNKPEQLSSKKEYRKEEQVQNFRHKHRTQFNEFMIQTSENNVEKPEEPSVLMSGSFTAEEYKPPAFDADKGVIIPSLHLSKNHKLEPKVIVKRQFEEEYRGHHLWKGEWAVAETGGLHYIDKEKQKQQRGVLTFIIRRIGKNLLSGKGILNISLPVDIFCRESNIERLAMSFGFFPVFMEKVVDSDPIEQLKAIICSVMGSSLIYLTMDKPFNPILGQTYQCWIDGCPVYFEQISHHPPIASYLMKGRGYQIYGNMEAKMDISINSGTGINQGIFTIKFDNGRTFHFTTPPGQLTGLTYGVRKLCMVEKTYFWSVEEGLFLELVYNPLSRQSKFFGGGKTYVGEQRLADYFEGILRKYKPEDLRQHLAPKKNSTQKMPIPKSLPPHQPLVEYSKVHGRWTKKIFYDQQKLFDSDTSVHLKYHDELCPLPSHSNFREDVVYRKINEFVLSQEWKEILQVKQRRDRKLRETFAKKKK